MLYRVVIAALCIGLSACQQYDKMTEELAPEQFKLPEPDPCMTLVKKGLGHYASVAQQADSHIMGAAGGLRVKLLENCRSKWNEQTKRCIEESTDYATFSKCLM